MLSSPDRAPMLRTSSRLRSKTARACVIAISVAALSISPITADQRSAAQTPPHAPSNVSTAAKPPRCARLAASMTRSEQIGQLLMVGIGSGGITRSQGKVLANAHTGSVILLGNSTAGAAPIKRLTKKVRAAAGKSRGVSVMLTVDQEGGKVQRLRGRGFDRIPSAKRQAALSTTLLTQKAERWGLQLRRAGINANLSPVADVVPKKLEKVNQPIGALQRGFGPNPNVVAAKVPAVVKGMRKAGISTAVKHFPGLGRVRGNTDFQAHVVDKTTVRHDRALKGFAAGATAKVDMVMVSSAFYTKIDPHHRAVFSKIIIGQLVRKDLKFTGVVISDDLAAKAVQNVSPGKRAVSYLKAGGDLLIVGDSRQVPAMVKAVKAKAKSDPRFAAQLTKKATRVLAMKSRRGLASCG